MSDERRHPDLFTGPEALEYLHLPADSMCTLETLRKNEQLKGWAPGRETLYHRAELDALVTNAFAEVRAAQRQAEQRRSQPTTGPRLQMSIGGGK